MDYIEFLGRCILRSWQISYGFFAIIDSICILIAAGILWHTSLSKKDPKKWERPAMKAAFLILAVSFLISVCFIAPYQEFHDKDILAQEKAKTPAPIKLDVADLEGRRDLRETRDQLLLDLEKAKKKIMQLESESRDPMSQPIASAVATAIIKIESKSQSGLASNSGLGTNISLCDGNSGFLIAMTANYMSLNSAIGEAEYKITAECSVEDPYMGHPVSDILKLGYIQITISSGIVPNGAKILGGSVTWVINNAITFKFDIPKQIAGNQNSNSLIFIRGGGEGLKTILKSPLHQP